MYCNNCGKHNPRESNFCKYCGSEITKISSEITPKNDSHIQDSESDHKNAKPSLSGWLAVVGFGLVLGLAVQAYGTIEYIPLLSETYDIPGYLGLLQIEFYASIILGIFNAYLLYLYFKKNKKFPKLYVVYLIASTVYVLLDHFFLATLTAPTPEQQEVIEDALNQNAGDVGRTIVSSVIWVWYIKVSKQVKVTFVNS